MGGESRDVSRASRVVSRAALRRSRSPLRRPRALLRGPRGTLLLTLLAIAPLAILGLHVERHLSPTSLSVPGTDSARGQALLERRFGDSSPFTILLRGPAPALDRQGPALAAALRARGATVISAWDSAAPADLRPGPRRALVLADFHVPLPTAMRHTVPAVEAALAARIRPPVRATQSGYATISRALQHESLAATERAELLAAPLLLIVLLLVFRSLVAALIPLAMGALTVLAGRGVLVLLSGAMTIDALSLVVCTMMGLALGVDYSLLIVSRFREELTGGSDRAEAARRTRATAGRTVAFAGATLFIAIFVSAFLQPGSLLVSLASALVVVTAISILLAWLALPALLALLGPRINAARLPRLRRRDEGAPSRVAAAAGAVLRRPALAAVVIAIPLALLAVPAVGFATGAPGVDELSTSNPARQGAEEIDRVVGPGWEAPFVVLAAAPEGPITTRPRLRALARAQHRIVALPGVQEVVGPAPLVRLARPLRALGHRLEGGGRAEGGRGDDLTRLARLGPGLDRAASGVARLRAGVAAASAGSGLIGRGAERAQHGAGLLASGFDRARAASHTAAGAIDRLDAGAARLAKGQREAVSASLSLQLGLDTLAPSLRGNSLDRARRLAHDLSAEAAADPALAKRAEQARILSLALASQQAELNELRAVSTRLEKGLHRLADGGKRLESGTARLATAAGRFEAGLARLGSGADRLAAGLGALSGGAGTLTAGLANGYHRSYPLQAGLSRAGARVAAETAPLVAGARRLRRASPRLFDSGYLLLSALDGAPPARRALAGETIDLNGGAAARMLVVTDAAFNTAASRRAGAAILAQADRLGRESGLLTGVTGGPAILNDYGSATRARLPLVIGSIIAITFLLLIAILRAPLLAALTIVLNLASVGAAIGVMTLVCKIPAGYPLGGHPYINTVGAAAIFGVTFGLSIDYAVFLLARMRERYERDADNRAAIQYGLEKTAGVITGAAAIMAAVFVSFAAAPIASVNQMGVGLTVAILLDATVVRIVLLPALMLLLGDRVWHVPAWLARILPDLNVHGTDITQIDTTQGIDPTQPMEAQA